MAKERGKETPELTRKQIAIGRRQREQALRIKIFTGVVVALALVILAIGALDQFIRKPNLAIAKVGDVSIRTKDFWHRVQLERNNLEGRLEQYRRLDAQFASEGGQSLFAGQISQLESLLANPESFSLQVLEQMIDEEVVRKVAAQRGVVVSPEEIEQRLRSQVASSRGFLTGPDATATAEARAQATATAASWTPTPTSNVNLTITPTPTAPFTSTEQATPTPTPSPTPTVHIMTEEEYQQGLKDLESFLARIASMSLDEYRRLIEVQLLEEKLREQVANEVPTVEEQVHARHILIAIRTPTPTPTPLPAGSQEPTPTPTATPLPGESQTSTPTPTPEPRTEEQALALAQELVKRLRAGEDFAKLAQEFSDDLGSKVNGGDLGWFGRGQMVPEFEQLAFSLEPGQISDPVKTMYGYHIIQVLEKDLARPVEPFLLEQRRAEAYQKLLNEQRQAIPIERYWSPDKVPPTPTPLIFPRQ
ncbi:MAG: peptidylprolyl isomerase [Anaerolineae bacterium]|nr:peptidylprolyl isomerase [Anaerolineae bacterium]MDW8099970.1 peptidylprolyl isomerase [Anaerolineae bacterium]